MRTNGVNIEVEAWFDTEYYIFWLIVWYFIWDNNQCLAAVQECEQVSHARYSEVSVRVREGDDAWNVEPVAIEPGWNAKFDPTTNDAKRFNRRRKTRRTRKEALALSDRPVYLAVVKRVSDLSNLVTVTPVDWGKAVTSTCSLAQVWKYVPRGKHVHLLNGHPVEVVFPRLTGLWFDHP